MNQQVPDGAVIWLDGWVRVGPYIAALDCYRTSAGPAARWIIEGVYNRRGVVGNMRSMGVDISKMEYSAVALAISGQPFAVAAWRNEYMKDSESEQLGRFYTWLYMQIGLFKPDIIAVEELAVFMNKNTIRTLGRREGVALLAANRVGRRRDVIVLNPPVGSARNAALGLPANCKKELAWETIKKMYPDFKFARVDQGGMDQGDAMTHALAAPRLLERRKR